MLKSSPHNEDFILAVATRPEDLALIANQYIIDVGFEDPGHVHSEVDLKNGKVTSRHGDPDDPTRTTFYIVQVEILA